ncbi:hypothetical protein GUITHDRAFT_64740 [Guillardia theta CCMP2712]|uniref:Methyltransferase domain-containing protein n=1 Tax=Guillardia theta (strain CCMP2712) TaxID=905079 RepID=L1JXL9_GUITC|nr:hypothetical protein GUITHDRAFT_64740 [Guillardia theta CCMP2712]EKX52828.1 hypothetical protein GUITHDRAFT_64740 [Guillardia theta CCMP2712]|eukprot:XP_005839808.1 hypothetical protein GUITHDRAFT_64740 [Guillardia theta CCMP2712]
MHVWKCSHANSYEYVQQALVPGCGRGYDVFEFARFGYTALGIDLSTTAVHEATKLKDEISAKEKLPGDASFSLQNFYELQPPKEGFDIIWDYTFLCAMPPEFREKWAKNMRRLIAPDGELVTLIYPLGDYEGGPPYAMSRELVSSLLEPQALSSKLRKDDDVVQGFESTYMEPVTGGLSHPSREGKEVCSV